MGSHCTLQHGFTLLYTLKWVHTYVQPNLGSHCTPPNMGSHYTPTWVHTYVPPNMASHCTPLTWVHTNMGSHCTPQHGFTLFVHTAPRWLSPSIRRLSSYTNNTCTYEQYRLHRSLVARPRLVQTELRSLDSDLRST